MFNNRGRALATAGLLAASLVAITACSSSPATTGGGNGGTKTKDITIGISSEGQSLPYVAAIVLGMQKEAKAKGVKVVLTDAQLTTSKQSSDIQDLISQKPDGIIILPLDGVVGQGQVNSIVQAGIPVVAAGSEIGNPLKRPQEDVYPKLVALVVQNELNVGSQAATIAKKVLPSGGDIGVILGAPGYAEDTLRMTKFTSSLDSSYKIVATQPGQWTPDAAQSACQNMITSNPTIKLFYTLSDDMALGCSKALAAAKSDAKVIGVGGYPAVVNILKSSTPNNIAGTVCFNPLLMGKLAVDQLLDHIQKKSTKLGQFVTYPTLPVTAQNIDKCVPGY